jgi:hypothetical protein
LGVGWGVTGVAEQTYVHPPGSFHSTSHGPRLQMHCISRKVGGGNATAAGGGGSSVKPCTVRRSCRLRSISSAARKRKSPSSSSSRLASPPPPSGKSSCRLTGRGARLGAPPPQPPPLPEIGIGWELGRGRKRRSPRRWWRCPFLPPRWTEIRCLGVHQARCASRLRIRRPNTIQRPKTNPVFFAQGDRVNQASSSSRTNRRRLRQGSTAG